MPWYKTGTVSVVQNSNAVIGTNTAFIANARVGDAFRGPDGGWYEVTNIASDTALSISPNYQGITNGAGVYALAPMQGYVKDSADALRALVNQYGAKLAALGTTGNYEILPITKGGTGATDQAGARTALNLVDTNGLPEGANNKYFTLDRVLQSVLTGLSLASSAVVVATDTVLGAIGKLQAQVTARAMKGANGDITSLTGLTTALSISQGGTGTSNATTARANLGAASAGNNSDIVNLTGLNSAKINGSNNANAQGLWLMWNTGIVGASGTADFICNQGGGSGGFTWRSVNINNTVGGPTMYYTYSGNLNVPGTVSQGSDRRLKKNDVEISDGLERIMRIRPVEFDRRDFLDSEDYPHHEVGVIAQELFEITPLLVTPADPESEQDIWRVNYTGLIPYLVSAIKTLKTEIEELKAGA